MRGLVFKLKSLMIKKNEFFDDELINKLNNEHTKLFEIYQQILENLEKDNFSEVKKLIQEFYHLYKLHILVEDKQLYTYLSIKYRFIPEKSEFIKQKQKEMNQITDFIEQFAKEYKKLSSIKGEKFKQDLSILADSLIKRVKLEEEKLYPLYFSNNFNTK